MEPLAVLRSDPSVATRRRFVLYVEGPSDCEILRTWARLLSPALARAVESCAVILGGRRPARALQHFGEILGREDVEPRALCVLDRDDCAGPATTEPEPPGFEFFTWPRRHIESYLLVPDAIRGSTRLSSRDPRVHRLLREVLPKSEDAEAIRALDAKRLLKPNGLLSRELGATVHPAGVARHMNKSDLHEDVLHLLERLREGVGLGPT